MKSTRLAYAIIMASLLALPIASFAASPAAIDAMEEFLDFSEYGGATILPEQIPAEDWKKIFVIDTRDAECITGISHRFAWNRPIVRAAPSAL